MEQSRNIAAAPFSQLRFFTSLRLMKSFLNIHHLQMSRLRGTGAIIRRSDPVICNQLRLQGLLIKRRQILSDAEVKLSIAMHSLYMSDVTLEDHIQLHGDVPSPELEALRLVVKEQELVATPFFVSVGQARQDVEDVTVQCLQSASNTWPGINVVGIDPLTDSGLIDDDTQL